eukprot:CAMPEP_0175759574 /NCGR_PEP_ID=MMETSP0097-20121207/65639_1 /TAXON_ID=311494 /ORGANISM="Alexandrium monilatum, Strain CCMP3105" /LENGTH=33 /DNA_ID= /DNA_START= /DNA_END= /DNA_ORIENTATION=
MARAAIRQPPELTPPLSANVMGAGAPAKNEKPL